MSERKSSGSEIDWEKMKLAMALSSLRRSARWRDEEASGWRGAGLVGQQRWRSGGGSLARGAWSRWGCRTGAGGWLPAAVRLSERQNRGGDSAARRGMGKERQQRRGMGPGDVKEAGWHSRGGAGAKPRRGNGDGGPLQVWQGWR
jgi:hypothetical protein